MNLANKIMLKVLVILTFVIIYYHYIPKEAGLSFSEVAYITVSCQLTGTPYVLPTHESLTPVFKRLQSLQYVCSMAVMML
jgi:hypothetical protein